MISLPRRELDNHTQPDLLHINILLQNCTGDEIINNYVDVFLPLDCKAYVTIRVAETKGSELPVVCQKDRHSVHPSRFEFLITVELKVIMSCSRLSLLFRWSWVVRRAFSGLPLVGVISCCHVWKRRKKLVINIELDPANIRSQD